MHVAKPHFLRDRLDVLLAMYPLRDPVKGVGSHAAIQNGEMASLGSGRPRGKRCWLANLPVGSSPVVLSFPVTLSEREQHLFGFDSSPLSMVVKSVARTNSMLPMARTAET